MVMDALKEGELKSSPDRKAQNPGQAIAKSLSEVNVSCEGKKAQPQPAESASQNNGTGPSQRELYEVARKRGLPGRSRMTKAQLARPLAR